MLVPSGQPTRLRLPVSFALLLVAGGAVACQGAIGGGGEPRRGRGVRSGNAGRQRRGGDGAARVPHAAAGARLRSPERWRDAAAAAHALAVCARRSRSGGRRCHRAGRARPRGRQSWRLPLEQRRCRRCARRRSLWRGGAEDQCRAGQARDAVSMRRRCPGRARMRGAMDHGLRPARPPPAAGGGGAGRIRDALRQPGDDVVR